MFFSLSLFCVVVKLKKALDIVADHCEYKKVNIYLKKKKIFENNLFKLHTVFLHQRYY